jgi:perosamine synthetase
MISIAKPQIGEKEKELVMQVLNSGVIAQGPKVKEFEEKFSEYAGVKHSIATSSGTTALHIALLAHGIKPGDEVITTPFTFIASANSILYCGAKPVFADINKDTFNLDVAEIKKKITKKTKAILPVHLYGNAAGIDGIMELAEKKDLLVIEDACQAHGAMVGNKMAGSFSTGAFSFYPTKNMTTGEGGMITTDDEKISEKCRMLREHGSKIRYYHEILGYNFRMTDINAAIGIAQLERLPEFNVARIRNAEYLTKGLSKVKGIISPNVPSGTKHVFHQYTLRVTSAFGKTRDELAGILKEKGIGTGIHYPLTIHKQELYKKLGYKDKMPVAEKAAKEVLSLPVHPAVTQADLDYIINAISSA